MPELILFSRAFFLKWLTFSFVLGLLTLACFRLEAREQRQKERNFADCLSCHQGIERISRNHLFECKACHLKPSVQNEKILPSHEPIVRNPSSPENMDQFCRSCHEKEIRNLKKSLHWSAAGIINQTRYLWGAQKSATPPVYGIKEPLKPLPGVPNIQYMGEPRKLVDDFLRRRCLRCHMHTRGPGGEGLYRATGCAACHMHYREDGRYRGNDAAMDNSKPGYPAKHRWVKSIPNEQCRHCHCQNHVGSDYEGFFEKDFPDVFRSPQSGMKKPLKTHGMDYHRLAKDIHAIKGLWCIDCHKKEHVMGNGQSYSYQMAVPKRACEDCHGGFDGRKPDLACGDLTMKSESLVLISNHSGRQYEVPRFLPDVSSHGIYAHKRVRCGACHAQWSFQDYGLSVMYEAVIQDYRWVGRSAQGDPEAEKELEKQMKSDMVGYPESRDWLTRQMRPGIWSMGWRFRRWSPMPLGVDQQGRIALLRPRYQYLISWVDVNGRVLLDSIAPQRGDGSGRGWSFMPYVPHTIAPFGRDCLSCHKNAVAAGLGSEINHTPDSRLMIPSPPAIREMRLLNSLEQQRLLKPGPRWHKEQIKSLKTFSRTP